MNRESSLGRAEINERQQRVAAANRKNLRRCTAGTPAPEPAKPFDPSTHWPRERCCVSGPRCEKSLRHPPASKTKPVVRGAPLTSPVPQCDLPAFGEYPRPLSRG